MFEVKGSHSALQQNQFEFIFKIFILRVHTTCRVILGKEDKLPDKNKQIRVEDNNRQARTMQSQSPNQAKNNKRPKLLSMMGNQSDIHVQQDRLHNQNERLFTCVYTSTAVVACQESKRVITYLLSLQIPFGGI
ncbi:uncharacterized protein [Triticum aestivum]|uniref:uncharacterized protein n=1 Tax=Triticum aestivum TaxID=4565 RepID=UPI001D032EA2|nr:uncharacterized protein LOC123046343 [Triticum aestivum]